MTENITVYKNPEFYSSFPSVVKMVNGELLITFRQAGERSVIAAKEGYVTHHDPDTWIATIRSKDNGESWEKETYQIVYNDKKCAVNDPGLTALADGRLLLRFNVLDVIKSANNSKIRNRNIVSHRVEHGLICSIKHNIIITSENNGESWDKKPKIIKVDGYTETSSRDPIVELDDGTLILSVYAGAPSRTDRVFLLRSFDNGNTWGNVSTIIQDKESSYSQHDGINYNETAVIPLDENHLLAMARTDVTFHTEGESMVVGGIGEMTQVESFDAGFSWTKPKPTGIFGQPPHLLRIDGSRIVLTYGYRKLPYGIRAVVSYDNGKTWDIDNPIIIRDDGLTWDIGYPSSVQIDENTVLTIYYFVDKNGTRFIESTKWNLKK